MVSNSEISAPLPATISFAKSRLVRGYIELQSRPEQSTATVGNPTSSAALCATASIPKARPETITIGVFLSPPIRRRQTSMPYWLAFLEPTTHRNLNSALGSCPRTKSLPGQSFICLSFSGKSERSISRIAFCSRSCILISIC